MVLIVRDSMDKVKQAYKWNFDDRICRALPALQVGDSVFHRKEYNNPEKERCYMLAPIADGTYKVVPVNTSSVVLDIDGHYQRVSQDHVYRAPNPTQDSVPTLSTGNEASTTSESTATVGHHAISFSVLPHPHHRLSDLLDAEKTPSNIPLLSRVIDRHTSQVPTPPMEQSTGLTP